MPQAAVLSLSSRLTSAFHTWTNPNGEEANWSAIHSPMQNRVVIYLRKTGMLALAGVAVIESLALWVLRSGSRLLSPMTMRPYNFFAKWLESSTFTIRWNWNLMAWVGRDHSAEMYTRESTARYLYYPWGTTRPEDTAELLRHPWATDPVPRGTNDRKNWILDRIEDEHDRLVEGVVRRVEQHRTVEGAATSGARKLISVIPNDLANRIALNEGRLGSPVLRRALLQIAVQDGWKLECFATEANLAQAALNPSPDLLERFASDPQIAGPRGFFCAHVLPAVHAQLRERSIEQLATRLADEFLMAQENTQNPGRDALIEKFRARDPEVIAFGLTKMLTNLNHQVVELAWFAWSQTMRRVYTSQVYPWSRNLSSPAPFIEAERQLGLSSFTDFERELIYSCQHDIPRGFLQRSASAEARIGRIENSAFGVTSTRESQAWKGGGVGKVQSGAARDITQGFEAFRKSSFDIEYYKPLAEHELGSRESGLPKAVAQASEILGERLALLRAGLAPAPAASAAAAAAT